MIIFSGGRLYQSAAFFDIIFSDGRGGILMKIIHCADLHLDSKMETSLDADKARERREELLATFSRMVDYADHNDIRVIIIAGDLFDTPAGTGVRIKRRVTDRIAASPEIDFLYLKGNHDRAGFDGTIPENLKMFGNSWKYYDYGDAVIAGCDIGRGSQDAVYTSLMLDPDRFNIAVMHGQTADHVSDGMEWGIDLGRLRDRNIDYLALGHIHSFSSGKLDRRGIYCYPGCLEGRGFDECGKKGFVRLDISEGKMETSFFAICSRQIHEIRVRLQGDEDESTIMTKITDALEGIGSKDMVRVVLEGEINEDTDVDTDYLARNFEPRFYLFRIKDETVVKIDYEKYADDISLKGEFIRTVKKRDDLSDEQKGAVIMLGLRALAGREIDI